MVAIHLSCELATDPVVHRLVNIWQANANRLMDMRCSVNITPSPMTCGHLLSNQLRLRSRWFTLVQRRVPVQMTPFQHKHIITLKLTRRTVRSINVWDIDAILFFFFFWPSLTAVLQISFEGIHIQIRCRNDNFHLIANSLQSIKTQSLVWTSSGVGWISSLVMLGQASAAAVFNSCQFLGHFPFSLVFSQSNARSIGFGIGE